MFVEVKAVDTHGIRDCIRRLQEVRSEDHTLWGVFFEVRVADRTEEEGASVDSSLIPSYCSNSRITPYDSLTLKILIPVAM